MILNGMKNQSKIKYLNNRSVNCIYIYHDDKFKNVKMYVKCKKENPFEIIVDL